jgi:hypothetical protein
MLSNIERQLLHHYSERERVIGGRRTTQHQRLLAVGYIREQTPPTGGSLSRLRVARRSEMVRTSPERRALSFH